MWVHQQRATSKKKEKKEEKGKKKKEGGGKGGVGVGVLACPSLLLQQFFFPYDQFTIHLRIWTKMGAVGGLL